MTSRWTTRNVAIGLATIVVFVLTFYAPVPARAQVAGATLSGTVQDSSGAVVPNANISVKNTETGVSRDVTADTAGLYNVPNLSPGDYEVTVTAQGFSKLVRSGITLIVGAQQALNLSLQVGQVSQTVEVTAEAPSVELTSSAITAEVNSTTMRELPLNGRDWSSLATLQPGTIGIKTQQNTTNTSSRGARGFGNELTISGHRPQENNYRVNGFSVNDYSNGSPGSVLGAQLGVDAIQEFTVLTSNYTAEYGRTSGGVINAITKPGTNAFHGSAYWFLRDEGLDAKSFFSPTRLPFHRNQFGGSAGGPIKKDNTFWFADYEGVREDLSINSTNVIVPSAAVRLGTLCSQPTFAPAAAPCTPHQITGAANPDPTTGISKTVLPYLPLWPLPNGGFAAGGSGDTGIYISSPYQTSTENYVTSRVDHRFSDKDSLDGIFVFDRSSQLTPDVFIESLYKTFSERILGGLEETHVFSPQLVNTFRAGFNRTTSLVGAPAGALQPIAANTSLGIGPGLPSPGITITGIQGGIALNSFTYTPELQNSIQFYDDAFLTHGNQVLKFGVSAERLQHYKGGYAGINGAWAFGSLTAFLQNVPNTASLPAPVGSDISGRQTFYGLYVQDDWRARPNLTINIGFRYEPGTLPTLAGGNPPMVLPNFFCACLPVANPTFWKRNQTLRDFEPRIGFAWDPFHNGKTSVRAGFGVFDVFPGPWLWMYPEQLTPPYKIPPPTAPLGSLPKGSFPTIPPAALLSGLGTEYAPDQNPKLNYAMNWNLNIQRQITSTVTATIAYVGSRTLHSPYTSGGSNIVLPVSSIGGLGLWPCGPPLDANGRCTAGHGATGTGGQAALLDPLTGQIRPTFWAGAGKYNSLQAQITKRVSHGLQVQGSYTWSKCLDNTESSVLSDQYTNSLGNEVFTEAFKNLSPCDYDIRHNFIGNWIWNIPGPKSSSAIVTHLTGGWQAGGIITVSTGTPFTVQMGTDPLGLIGGTGNELASQFAGCNPVNPNYRTTLQYLNLSCFTPAVAPASFISQCANFPNAPNPPPGGMVYCANLYGSAGRNSVYGPGEFNLDFSVFKDNYFPRISESFNIQFRAEFFNILNHTNFQSPVNNDALFNQNGSQLAGAGTLSGVVTDPREIQLALKVIW